MRRFNRRVLQKGLRKAALLGLVGLVVLLAGCDALRGTLNGLVGTLGGTPTPTGNLALLTPTRAATVTIGTPPSPSATPTPTLVVWLPPEFDPAGGTPAGALLGKRLDEFARLNKVEVRVRIKASSGPGGLFDSLSAASAAAPLALPSIIALPRGDLETAALKGLISPLDGVSQVIEQADWYAYARELARVEGATFDLPFAGDALVLAYRPTALTGTFTDWSTAVRVNQPVGFAAGDPQALFVLLLYQSAGGVLENAQQRPTLQPEALSRALQILADGEQRNVFPYWLSQYETNGQVWQAYRDGRVNALVTWSSNYLAALPPDTTAVPLPMVDDTALTLATGWGWAVADPLPERRALNVKLVEFLTDPDFLAAWSEQAGVLPTRPSSLAGWSNQSLKNFLDPVAKAAHARPSADQLASLGPVLKEAALKVLKHESDVTQAAKAASEKLAIPETK